MKKVLITFGTRPEAIKMMPVIKALRRSSELQTVVVVTGQHRQMLDQVFSAFGEYPDRDLQLMTPNQSLAQITASIITEMSQVMAAEQPDITLVHGDTTTAMAAAMAAFYARSRIGHVEAGLRTHDLQRPWPEEFNRVMIDSIADLLFAPTTSAQENLRSEYNKRSKILVTGNTGIDSLLHVSRLIDTDTAISDRLRAHYNFLDQTRKLVLVTGHRRESFGDGFERICDALANIARRPDVTVLYPVHLNPRVRDVVQSRLRGQSNIHLHDPVEYLDMVFLMKQAHILLTDSGGIQEEGPALGRPVLVMRDVTERPEALATGAVKLVGTDPRTICHEVFRLLDDRSCYAAAAKPVFPYGDGRAAERISACIHNEFR